MTVSQNKTFLRHRREENKIDIVFCVCGILMRAFGIFAIYTNKRL